ncbi:MAG: flagellar hook-basal body protein [Tissierellia bacterium]|nr:flagellar hook-basal body protein [Tissierellia bacterium]
MIKAYYTATNSAISNQKYLDVISNNMANIQTEGFKKSKASFSDLMYTNIRGVEGVNTQLISGSGSKLNKVSQVFSKGAARHTGVNTDYAINGEGFFAVQFEDKIMFTRGGSFEVSNIDDENYLTYQGGYVLNRDEEPIILENYTDIESDIESINYMDNVEIGVFVFDNNNKLVQAGYNLYSINEETEYNLHENSKVLQGFLETSNVEISEEMVDLINIQRAFQLNSRIIQTADEIEQTINSLKG